MTSKNGGMIPVVKKLFVDQLISNKDTETNGRKTKCEMAELQKNVKKEKRNIETMSTRVESE